MVEGGQHDEQCGMSAVLGGLCRLHAAPRITEWYAAIERVIEADRPPQDERDAAREALDILAVAARKVLVLSA
jgi:hypothetical protein